uniref:EGF-like domain-containing protein n=1 Tax=Meloidogyne incognita TaxID=6306 RepID=A0A914LI14_MELIC
MSKNYVSTKPKFLTNLQNKKELNTQKQPPNLCDLQFKNPCQNNGTCLWNENTEKYFCKCTEEYFGENCSKQIVFPWNRNFDRNWIQFEFRIPELEPLKRRNFLESELTVKLY